jgi:hypothetical protein
MNHQRVTHKQGFKGGWRFPALVGILVLFILPAVSFGQESQPQPAAGEQASLSQVALKLNPFTLPITRIAPNTIFKMMVDKTISSGHNWEITAINLAYTSEGKEKKIPVTKWYFKEIEGELYLYARMPGWDSMKGIKKQTFWRGILTTYRADLEIDYSYGGQALNVEFPIKLPDWKWALVWGIVIALLLIFLGSWGITGHFKWKNLDLSLKKLVLSYKGNISVSKTQVFIWTLVLLFGIIYVYRISEVFLEITPQILLFLGIGGATAVGAKYNAVKKSADTEPAPASPPASPPAEDKGKPKPDFFKVQMLSFTVVIAFIVVIEIIKTNTFPVMSENLVYVMGISNAVYIGNKVSDAPQKKESGGSS